MAWERDKVRNKVWMHEMCVGAKVWKELKKKREREREKKPLLPITFTTINQPKDDKLGRVNVRKLKKNILRKRYTIERKSTILKIFFLQKKFKK